MDFVRLGPRYTSDYIPEDIIEGYISLIWTERFQDPGEFELKTYDVERMKSLLPEDTLVSHLETQEVMMVETHEIADEGEGDDAVPVLTIRGRSAWIILAHRWVEAAYQKKRRMRKKYSGTGAICVLLSNAVDNASGKDITRGDTDPDIPGGNDYSWTTLDVIPNVAITESVSAEGEARWWQLEEGELLPQIQNIMVAQDLGLRVLRPILPNTTTVVTVKSALAERGTIVRTVTNNVTALRFEVYSGVDRTSGAGLVQLKKLHGHLEKMQYLESNQDYKTVMEVMSGATTISDIYRPGESGLTGWRRKTAGFDAGTPELPAEPKQPKPLKKGATKAQKETYIDNITTWLAQHAAWELKYDAIIAEFHEEQRKAALGELKKKRKVDMVSGEISLNSPYQYKKHYNLGDAVMLFGDYGKNVKMVVYEYIRTEDVNGDRGVPGLVLP